MQHQVGETRWRGTHMFVYDKHMRRNVTSGMAPVTKSFVCLEENFQNFRKNLKGKQQQQQQQQQKPELMPKSRRSLLSLSLFLLFRQHLGTC